MLLCYYFTESKSGDSVVAIEPGPVAIKISVLPGLFAYSMDRTPAALAASMSVRESPTKAQEIGSILSTWTALVTRYGLGLSSEMSASARAETRSTAGRRLWTSR